MWATQIKINTGYFVLQEDPACSLQIMFSIWFNSTKLPSTFFGPTELVFWFGLWVWICLYKDFLFMVEAYIFVSFKFGGPLVFFFFFKWYCGLTFLMFPGRTGWLFNYFTRTHMTIFEGHFLITYCLVLWWWWFFSPTRYSFQGKIPCICFPCISE